MNPFKFSFLLIFLFFGTLCFGGDSYVVFFKNNRECKDSLSCGTIIRCSEPNISQVIQFVDISKNKYQKGKDFSFYKASSNQIFKKIGDYLFYYNTSEEKVVIQGLNHSKQEIRVTWGLRSKATAKYLTISYDPKEDMCTITTSALNMSENTVFIPFQYAPGYANQIKIKLNESSPKGKKGIKNGKKK